jgi:aryl-alcohol dehydrogenase-like predicted oxidoreductase
MKCPVHKVELVCYCPVCRGSLTSKRKAAASRENGKLGGRPKGSKNKPKSNPQKERR